MSLFIKKVILFNLFFLTVFIVILSVILSLNRIRVKSCLFGDEIETLIAGDSHTMWSIDDKRLDKVRNISLNAEGYIYTYAKLKHLLKQKSNIKELYLGLSYHNLSGYYDDYLYGGHALSFFHRYIPVLGPEDYLKLFKSNPKNIIKMSPILLREGIWSLFNDKSAFLGTFPSQIMRQTLDPEKMKERIKDQYYRNGSVVTFSKMNIEYLIKIIDLCKSYNVKVTALATPLQKDYNWLIPCQYTDEYNRFTREHGLAVFDFSGLELPDSCYLPDGDHVNYNGALVITEYFKEYITKENKHVGF